MEQTSQPLPDVGRDLSQFQHESLWREKIVDPSSLGSGREEGAPEDVREENREDQEE